MTAALRRGACPTLAGPMASGDGWLARLAVPELTPAALAGLARAAVAHGNGVVEVTSRGSLQIRGLAEGGGLALAAALAAAGIVVPALPVLSGPLAGVDPGEVADPRPLARALSGYRRPLHPKVSVVVDGGGQAGLDGLAADLRLRAVAEGWMVVAATAVLGVFDAAGAVARATGVLDRLSAAGCRARELAFPGAAWRPGAFAAPVGGFRLRRGLGRGVALPAGIDGPDLAALAAAAGAARLRPGPGRTLVAVGLDTAADAGFREAARGLGLITEAGDPRLAVAACPGAPACASGLLPARAIAARVAGHPALPGGVRLHVSGCPKRCAQPVGPAVTLVGTPEGPRVTGEGVAVGDALRAFLVAQAEGAG